MKLYVSEYVFTTAMAQANKLRILWRTLKFILFIVSCIKLTTQKCMYIINMLAVVVVELREEKLEFGTFDNSNTPSTTHPNCASLYFLLFAYFPTIYN